MSDMFLNDNIKEENCTSKCEEVHLTSARSNLVEKQLLVIFLQLVQSRQKRFKNQRKNHRAFISSPDSLGEETCEVLIFS